MDFDIKATLSARSRGPVGIGVPFIRRGASAELTYDLFDRGYDFNGIDQFTYMLKQGGKLLSYVLFRYYKPAEGVAESGKEYYELSDIKPDNSCVGHRLDIEEGEELPIGSYVLTDGNDCERQSTLWEIDEHFMPYIGEGFGYISFMLSSDETKAFAPTTPDDLMLAEVAIRFDTDEISDSYYLDSVVIEPQPAIAVFDSLYSRLQ